MNVLVLEDNIMQLNGLVSMLTQSFQNIVCYKSPSYENAIELLHSNVTFDLFILDIQLNNQLNKNTGLDFGRCLRKISKYTATPIIFITSFANKIYEAINDIHCYSFLAKPYSANDLINSVKSLINIDPNSQKLFIKDLMGVGLRLDYSSIIYISVNKKILYITTTKSTFCTRDYTLDKIEKMLPSEFIRCHKSHIINQYYLYTIDNVTNTLQLQGVKNTLIPIGRKYANNIKEK